MQSRSKDWKKTILNQAHLLYVWMEVGMCIDSLRLKKKKMMTFEIHDSWHHLQKTTTA